MTSAVNRYYDPTTDQFMSVDPDFAASNQPYAFTNDDPLNQSDPTGELGCGFLWLGNCKPKKSTKSSTQEFTCNSSSGNVEAGYSSSGIDCQGGPLVSGSIKPGSTASQARAAAEDDGYPIPPNYVAERQDNGQGWVFRAPGSTGNNNIVRVGEPNSKNSNGYVRYYNDEGQPVTGPGSTQTGSNDDTHLPLGDGDGDPDVIG